jgi:putative ABC transport system permease protein
VRLKSYFIIAVRNFLRDKVTSIVNMSLEMLKPVFLGFIVATPLAALAMSKLLTINDYHIRLSWWFFAAAGTGAVLVALATVSYHGLWAARINPARSLQTE